MRLNYEELDNRHWIWKDNWWCQVIACISAPRSIISRIMEWIQCRIWSGLSGSHNVLCKRVSSAVLYEGFVRTSGIQPAVYHHTVVTVCFAELFLDVMLPCFVLQQLKMPPDLTGHGLKIQSALFLIRVCRRYYCVVYYSPQGAWLVKWPLYRHL